MISFFCVYTIFGLLLYLFVSYEKDETPFENEPKPLHLLAVCITFWWLIMFIIETVDEWLNDLNNNL